MTPDNQTEGGIIMRYIITLLISFIFLTGIVTQGYSVTFKMISTSFDASYNAARSYNDNFKSNDSIDHANSYGYGIETKIGLTKIVNITLGFNYTNMRVSEYDPVTAYSRTGFPYWSSHWNNTKWYINYKSADGLRNIFDVAYDYQYHMNYINLLLGVEVAPLPEGRFKPFFGAGIAPTKFGQRGYWVTDITGRIEDRVTNTFIGKWHYRIRAHAATRNKHRGYIFNGYVFGGFEFKITQGFGFQMKARYFQTIADNKRNRITGFYNINTGIVIYGL